MSRLPQLDCFLDMLCCCCFFFLVWHKLIHNCIVWSSPPPLSVSLLPSLSFFFLLSLPPLSRIPLLSHVHDEFVTPSVLFSFFLPSVLFYFCRLPFFFPGLFYLSRSLLIGSTSTQHLCLPLLFLLFSLFLHSLDDDCILKPHPYPQPFLLFISSCLSFYFFSLFCSVLFFFFLFLFSTTFSFFQVIHFSARIISYIFPSNTHVHTSLFFSPPPSFRCGREPARTAGESFFLITENS